MSKILVVHHTVSPPLQELLESILGGLQDAAVALDAEIEVTTRPALIAGPMDLLLADAIILGTPANIGYMSGALKHFFDQVYYPCLNDSVGLPFGFYLHGNDDTAGARRGIEKITKGLQWRAVRPPVESTGKITAQTREACTDLAGLIVAAVC